MEMVNKNYKNVHHLTIDLSSLYNHFHKSLSSFESDHAFANSKSRLRMVTLHHISGSSKGIVVGTGNKVEDFGVGFIQSMETEALIYPHSRFNEVRSVGIRKKIKYLTIYNRCSPTDGLWEDGRTDKDQLGD